MQQFYAVTNYSDRNELLLFGQIGGGFLDDGFTEQDVARMFEDVRSDLPLDVVINSIGGSIPSALAIKGMIERHPSPVTIRVSGLAASAATLITSASNARCVMNKGSLMMIHKPRCAAQGTPQEIRQTLEVLEKWSSSMEDIYCAKSHKSREEVAKIMQEETWFSADEAVAAGFADEVDSSIEAEAVLAPDKRFLAIGGRTFDLSVLPFNAKMEKKLMTIHNDQAPEMKAEEKKAQEASAQSPLTAEALLKDYPDQIAQIVAKAVAQERERIKAIADLDDGTCPEIIAAAQFAEPLSPADCALKLMKEKRQKAMNAKADLYQDGKELADALSDVQWDAKTLPHVGADVRQSAVSAVQAQMKTILGY